MTEKPLTKRVRFRLLRRLLKSIVFLIIGIVLLSFGGVAVVWGHFWDFRVGDPTSESCGNCHLLEQYVESQSDATLLVSNHVREGVGCIDCHPQTIDLQITETIAYLQNNYTQPFVRAEYPMDTCFQCHEHSSYDQLVWRTTDLGITDPQAKGTIANPHQPPHFEELECFSCHRMHQPSVLVCSECHAYVFRFPVLPQGD